MRNNYETRIGKFKGAVDPCTMAFREFPSWVEDEFLISHANDKHSKVELNGSNGSTAKREAVLDKKIPQRLAMYCTGGIRCEKASSYLLSKGFKEVNSPWNFHLPPAFYLFALLIVVRGACILWSW